MGPFEAMVFLDASSYFWTRLTGAGGRAGERARASKIISGDVFLFLDASSWSGWPGGRAGGRAGEGYSKIISGDVF